MSVSVDLRLVDGQNYYTAKVKNGSEMQSDSSVTKYQITTDWYVLTLLFTIALLGDKPAVPSDFVPANKLGTVADTYKLKPTLQPPE